MLSGCSSVVDSIPTAVGGMPEGVPARSAEQPPYPAVHDVPAGRGASTLSAAEKKLLQDDLIATRQRAIEQGTTATTEATGTAGNP